MPQQIVSNKNRIDDDQTLRGFPHSWTLTVPEYQ